MVETEIMFSVWQFGRRRPFFTSVAGGPLNLIGKTAKISLISGVGRLGLERHFETDD